MEYNQLRVNVRNYCVGLTCEEIEKLIASSEKDAERKKYLEEYLGELEQEQGRIKLDNLAVGAFFMESPKDSHIFMKCEDSLHHPVIFPSSDRGMTGRFYGNTDVYRCSDITITRDEY